jgi:hypothetical protein
VLNGGGDNLSMFSGPSGEGWYQIGQKEKSNFEKICKVLILNIISKSSSCILLTARRSIEVCLEKVIKHLTYAIQLASLSFWTNS